jgi:hypothetical protein
MGCDVASISLAARSSASTERITIPGLVRCASCGCAMVSQKR